MEKTGKVRIGCFGKTMKTNKHFFYFIQPCLLSFVLRELSIVCGFGALVIATKQIFTCLTRQSVVQSYFLQTLAVKKICNKDSYDYTLSTHIAERNLKKKKSLYIHTGKNTLLVLEMQSVHL